MKDRATSELFLELGEVAADLITKNEAVREIPVVGWAFKIAKAMEDIRSKLLTKKIGVFLSEPHLIAAVERLNARQKILDDDEHAAEVGEILLMVLDNVTDFDKPKLLALSYASYLDNVVVKEELLMIAHAIAISANNDLKKFVRNPESVRTGDGEWQERLVNSGLYKLGYASVSYGGAASVELSELGQVLWRIVKHYPGRF